MGARYLTVEELDRRHEEARQKLLAKQEEAAARKAEREAKKGGRRKLEMLEAFLRRSNLSLAADAGEIDVHWGSEFVGTLYEATGEPKTEDEAEEARRYEQEQALR